MKLLILSQTSTVQPVFAGYVITGPRLETNTPQIVKINTMTSSNGTIFRVTGTLCGEFTGPGEFPTQRPVTRSFDVSLICVWINGSVNNREAGELRRYRAHYDVIVMCGWCILGHMVQGLGTPLLWRHNERDGVSSHRRLDCLLNRLFRHRSTSKLRVTGLCAGNFTCERLIPRTKGQ